MQLSLVAFQINAPADNGTDDTIDCRTLRCRCYSAELAGSFHSPFSIARLAALNFSHDAHRMPLKTCYKSPALSLQTGIPPPPRSRFETPCSLPSA